MELNAFLEMLERVAPKALALEIDNVGLLVGTKHKEINRVLVALDCTVPVVNEAAEWGAELVLAHHPLMFGGVKRILPEEPQTAAVYELISHNIGMVAAHTNYDAAEGGVNDVLAELFGLSDVAPFDADGIGRIGRLREPLEFVELCRRARKVFGAPIMTSGAPNGKIATLAMLGGAGGDDAAAAARAGADAYITGEMRHHQLLEANARGLSVIVAGHYETESIALLPLISRLQSDSFEIEYKLAHCERSPVTIL